MNFSKSSSCSVIISYSTSGDTAVSFGYIVYSADLLANIGYLSSDTFRIESHHYAPTISFRYLI